MSGLIDAVEAAMSTAWRRDNAVGAVLAVADWLEGEYGEGVVLAVRLRAEVTPPTPPTAEDVIREVTKNLTWATSPARIAVALRDAGMLREADPPLDRIPHAVSEPCATCDMDKATP